MRGGDRRSPDGAVCAARRPMCGEAAARRAAGEAPRRQRPLRKWCATPWRVWSPRAGSSVASSSVQSCTHWSVGAAADGCRSGLTRSGSGFDRRRLQLQRRLQFPGHESASYGPAFSSYRAGLPRAAFRTITTWNKQSCRSNAHIPCKRCPENGSNANTSRPKPIGHISSYQGIPGIPLQVRLPLQVRSPAPCCLTARQRDGRSTGRQGRAAGEDGMRGVSSAGTPCLMSARAFLADCVTNCTPCAYDAHSPLRT